MISEIKLDSLTIRELKLEYRKLEKEFENYKKESIKWTVDDVITVAEDNNLKITRKQGRLILRKAIANHDATMGIDWETFLPWIQEAVKPKRKKKK